MKIMTASPTITSLIKRKYRSVITGTGGDISKPHITNHSCYATAFNNESGNGLRVRIIGKVSPNLTHYKMDRVIVKPLFGLRGEKSLLAEKSLISIHRKESNPVVPFPVWYPFLHEIKLTGCCMTAGNGRAIGGAGISVNGTPYSVQDISSQHKTKTWT
jgi:hypothetical protein